MEGREDRGREGGKGGGGSDGGKECTYVCGITN